MLNPTGSVVINGITDPELAEILEIKASHETTFTFNPQQLQPQNQGSKSASYNNAQFGWSGEDGLRVVQEIITMLLSKGEKAKAQGQ